MHEPRLLGTEKIAGATQLEILECDLIAGPELRMVFQNREAPIGIFVDRIRHQQIAARPAVRAADPAAQLIQLRQAEGVGAVHEHRVGVRNVEPRLHDHRRDEDVDLAVDELPHHLLELSLAHLPVSDADASARHDMADVLRHSIDRLDAVVDEENLAATIELARNAFVDQAIVPRLDEGEHGRPVTRRGLHQCHVAQASQREVKSSRNGRGGQREHISIESEPLEAFLVFDTEAVLFVNDDQSELGERDVRAQKAMRADDDIDLPRFETGEHDRLFLRRLKATECFHPYREIGQPLTECSRVLVGKDSRRHQHDHLPARLYRFEGGAHRDLGLAVANVADKEPIHGPRTLHVALHVGSGGALVGRILE